MRTFVQSDEKSQKFWNITLSGKTYTVTFGKVGTKGRFQVKDFPDEDKARAAYDKAIAEKLTKGYTETTPVPAVPATPLQHSLEMALVENPEDLAAHSAYADYLAEQGSPLGEFIQIQLALAAKPTETERVRLQARESALLTLHAQTWLGDAGRFLVGHWSAPDQPWDYSFARGWPDKIRLLPFPEAVLASVCREPRMRLLSRLEVLYDMRYHPFDFETVMQGVSAALQGEEEESDWEDSYEPVSLLATVLASPMLRNLRSVKLGFSDSADPLVHSTMINAFGDFTASDVIQLLQQCQRLEELYLNAHVGHIENLFASPALRNLRVLQYYFGSTTWVDANQPPPGYPLAVLAGNSALQRLTTLRLHPGRDTIIGTQELRPLVRSPNLPSLTHLQIQMTNFGDEGARIIVESGILRQLETLDLAYGNLTDAGAQILAECSDLRHLKTLNVSRNALTGQGINALREMGIQVLADNQHGDGDTTYLYEVDVE